MTFAARLAHPGRKARAAPSTTKDGRAGDPSDTAPLVRDEFHAAVYDRWEYLKKEIAALRYQLEFISPGHNLHGKPIQQLGRVILRTSCPPCHSTEDRQAVEVGRRRRAAATYQEEKEAAVAARDSERGGSGCRAHRCS